MIGKLVKGRSFRGALEYDLQKEKGRIISTNMAGKTPRELAIEFGEIRKLRPTLGKAVLHVSISAALGEKLTDQQWQKIGQRYLHGMGFTDNQHIITRHTDTEHEHIHILANRITHGGDVVSDSQDYRRQETLMREIEREYGLQQVAPSIDAQRRAPTKSEIEKTIRTAQPSTRQQLQQLCDAAAKDCDSYTDYQERLEAVGVELVPVVQRGGSKLSGLSYRLDGVTMKGSDLGKGYAAAGIQKRGISYEQNRDRAAISRSHEREEARTPVQPDRSDETGQEQERGGTGRDTGTAGPSHGSLGRRDTPDTGRDRPQEPGTGSELSAKNRAGDAGIATGSERSASGSGQPEASGITVGVGPLHFGDGHRAVYSGTTDRIFALAAVNQGRDRTAAAIARQITAIGAARFEVGIRDARTGQMLNREWSRAELEQSTAWLKRMNAKGNDVYIRPAGEHGLVLVDDLKADALARMEGGGWTPAAAIETSPGNYQAWVKLSDRPLPAEVRRMAARGLAKKYGGDPNSADSRHYGRLAGFTNQKPEHSRDGRQPYVLAHDCPGKAAMAAPEYLERIEQHLDGVEAQKERKRRIEALEKAKPGYTQHDPVKEYQRQAQNLMQRYGPEADYSRMDWMIATDMAQSGRFTVQDIEKGIRECSPQVDGRKAGHVEDYARRTAEKAWIAPEVQAHRQEQEQQAKRSRGFSPRPGW